MTRHPLFAWHANPLRDESRLSRFGESSQWTNGADAAVAAGFVQTRKDLLNFEPLLRSAIVTGAG
jgi:hypothetical protein